MLVCDWMIPAFLLNKFVSKILSLVLEKTGEDHSKLQNRLDILENELIDLKQSIEIKELKSGSQQQVPSKMTIDQITIENLHMESANLTVDLEKLISKGLIDQDLINQALSRPASPKINIQTKRK